jgi:PAS domain S-box-containing protein
VFEESPVAKAFVRPDVGRCLRVNPAFSQMLGYPPEEFLGLTVADVTHPEDRQMGAERLAAGVSRRIAARAV